jgi:hypothetical protein
MTGPLWLLHYSSNARSGPKIETSLVAVFLLGLPRPSSSICEMHDGPTSEEETSTTIDIMSLQLRQLCTA